MGRFTRAVRGGLLVVLLAWAGAGLAQACLTDPGGTEPLAWGEASCVEGVAAAARQQRTFVVGAPSERRFALTVASSGAESITLCVELDGVRHCRSGDGAATIPDLVLPAGPVTVVMIGRLPVGGRYRVALEDDGPARDGFEIEPNDVVAHATVLGPEAAIRGRLEGREADVFRFDVSGEPQLWRVQAIGAEVGRLRYHDASGRVLQERAIAAGERGIRLSNLYLLPGPHWFSVEGADADYALRLIPLGPADEPPATAPPGTAPPGTAPPGTAPPGTTASGSAGAAPESGPPATSSLGPAMVPTAPPPGADLPIALPSGPRPPGAMEREPNDDASRAHLLRPDEPWVGLLSEPRDVDVYRFHLGEEGYVRLTVVPPADGAIEANASGSYATPGVGEPYVYEAWLLAGDHVVSLRPAVVSEAYYQVRLERLDPFDLPDDLEPNDQPYQARALPEDLTVRGAVGTHRDADWFLLPPLATENDVTIDLSGDGARLGPVRDPRDGARVAAFALDRASGRAVARVPAGGPYAFEVIGQGAYELRVGFGPGAGAPEPRPRASAPALTVTLSGAATVAAYHPLGQRLTLEIELAHAGAAPIDVELEAHVSDHGWSATVGEPRLTLAAGETRRLPLHLEVAPGARDDLEVRVTVAVRSVGAGAAEGAADATDGARRPPATTVFIDLAAVCGLPPAGAHQAWPLPDALLGGINVAGTAVGAQPQTDLRRELLLYDGLTPPDGGWNAPLGGSTTVRLAGDPAPAVVGVLLHPLGADDVGSQLADFRVLTSIDGVAFEPILEARLRSTRNEQGFVFDAPRTARFLRLEFSSRQDGSSRGTVHLGQLKVVAEPGSRPLGDAVDLARREVGGHVVLASPVLATYALSEAGPRPLLARLDPGAAGVGWVMGFQHGRAAWIAGLGWRAHPEGDPRRRIDEVRVAVSLDGPLGPWTEVGSWRPHERPGWTFDAPLWARYVRFEADGFEPRSTVEFPDRIEVFEHPSGPDQRSVLGEWGHYERAGPYEWGHPPGVLAEAGAGHGHVDAATAQPLASGVAAEGRVLLGAYEAWFAVDVPAGQNHLRLELRGDPTIAYRYALTDAGGAAVASEVSAGLELAVLEAFVGPGRYLLRAWEPQRAVVFAWDNSGSMGPYIDAIYQAIAAFARGLDPDRERVQLLAFATDPRFIMDGWSGDPATVLTSLLAYDRSDGSSDAEVNLAYLVEQLAELDGTRAVLLLTDAESGATRASTVRLWQALAEVRPRVFAFETSSSASDDTQDRMQDWAAAAGGAYDYSRTLGDLDVGLERVSCLLRQPKSVRVVAHLVAREPPGPGALAVRRRPLDAEPDAAARPAVQVIFDASGSMGKVLPGARSSRLDVAREVLTQLVDEVLEPGTPFALRAYGHVRPNACDTRLELPLAPLDPASARRAIAGIEAKLLSGTPLAASIEAVASDLARASGPKTVVLITDGEESCGGDPEAAIRALVASGVEVRLGIVGFDVDAANESVARARFAAWAELGGGAYVEARDRVGLAAAIRASLEPPALRFEVVDAAGEIVADGVVDGDPVGLPAGDYRVRLGAGDARPVTIRHEALTTLVLEGEDLGR